YRELVSYIQPIENNYDKIVVSNKKDLSQSYIFFLFYLQYNPQQYQSNVQLNKGEEKSFSNYRFTDVGNKDYGNSLVVVGGTDDLPSGYRNINQIYYPDNSVAFKIGTR